MFTCRKESLGIAPSSEVLKKARQIIKEYRSKCLSKAQSEKKKGYTRPFIKSVKTRTKFYIDDFHYHINAKPYDDMVRRYSLIPCVFELLQFTKEKPVYSDKDNYYFLGISANNENFKVIVRKEKGGYALQSFHRT